MPGTPDKEPPGPLSGLAALIEQAGRANPPVERWSPPYCGDIGLAIRRDGTWTYRDSPILRPALVRLFASVLRREENGRHFLVTPAERVDVRVEDAPFLAVELERHGEGPGQRLLVRTNLDDVVALGADHPLRLVEAPGGALKPYVLVRGRLEALATRALTYELVEIALSGGDGAHPPGVWSDGAFFALPQGAWGHDRGG